MAVSDYSSLIDSASATYGVPASLISGVMQVESGGNPNALSSTGASGLMQLEPGTAASLGITNVFDPAQNIDAGTQYLATLLQQYGGDVPTALAAYNWGPGNIATSGGNIPPSVQDYVNNVMSQSGIVASSPASGGALLALSGSAAATPTADLLDQLQEQTGINLADPTTELALAGAAGLILFLMLR